MINEKQLQEKIDATPAPRVTKEQMEARIASVEFTCIGGLTVTICNISLNNGFSVRGESACVNLDNYVREIGEKIAYDNAFRQLWAFFGFLLAEDQFRNGGSN